jgi:NAD(P)-dependent dehydrogenase (short-subunit alcohol dehydrogenase family)
MYTADKGCRYFAYEEYRNNDMPNTELRCNSIHPATVETDLVKKVLSDPRLRDERIADIPLNRLCSPEDVANAVAFLASDKATFINGVQLPVDGGLSAR